MKKNLQNDVAKEAFQAKAQMAVLCQNEDAVHVHHLIPRREAPPIRDLLKV